MKGGNGTPSLSDTISRPLGLLGRSSNRKNASQSSNQETKHRRVIFLALSLHTSFVPWEPNVSRGPLRVDGRLRVDGSKTRVGGLIKYQHLL